MRISQPLFKYSKNWVNDARDETGRFFTHFKNAASSDSESNNANVRIGRLRGQINLKFALRLAGLQWPAVRQQIRRKHFGLQAIDLEGSGWPFENVDENLVFLRRYSNRRNALNWSIRSSVDRIPIDCEPVADCPETILKLRLNDPVRLRTHV